MLTRTSAILDRYLNRRIWLALGVIICASALIVLSPHRPSAANGNNRVPWYDIVSAPAPTSSWAVSKSEIPPAIVPVDPMPSMPPTPPNKPGTVIPDALHYAFILGDDPEANGGKKPTLHYYAYLFIRSAIKHLKPSVIYFHYDYLPSGPWWEEIRNYFTLVHHDAPKEVYGNVFHYNEHKTDAIRLLAMQLTGGIYLDSDMAVIRPFDEIMNAPLTMAIEADVTGKNVGGLCTAMVIAQPGAPFLDRWMESYESFAGTGPGTSRWGYHSIIMPWRLARAHPDEVQVLNGTAAFWPMWHPEHIKLVHETNDYDFESTGQFAYHAWSALAKPYLLKLTYESITAKDTSFHRLVRPRFIGPRDREIFESIAAA